MQVHGHVADFIEEQRSTLGRLQQALLAVLRAGEGALDMPEQLGFDQRGHQRGAIHRSKRALFAGSRKMHAPGHQFLAGAALPQNQNRILMQAHFLDDFINALHALGDADQAAEARPGAQLFSQQLIFLLQLHGPGGAFQARAQLLDAERLGDIVDRAQARGGHRGINRAVLRQHDHRQQRVGVMNALE